MKSFDSESEGRNASNYVLLLCVRWGFIRVGIYCRAECRMCFNVQIVLKELWRIAWTLEKQYSPPSGVLGSMYWSYPSGTTARRVGLMGRFVWPTHLEQCVDRSSTGRHVVVEGDTGSACLLGRDTTTMPCSLRHITRTMAERSQWNRVALLFSMNQDCWIDKAPNCVFC